ncbi:hypothetical protein WL61_17930 [Burkholderia ubonensis]|uniref:hypothetical protein n=1 Tax=Burkholderia ubonensis TaxID=101571 RepID=UPI000753E32C|nr:hypothetical protein [Burkholderia ubonensis]KVO80155.1 hypothetical protein WJ80_21570 [Burkholderia ubonensis]KVR20769.1 hypothetical protein WK14_21695 [Burkholderia ubonensis]KWD20530.1 hypothetical protein WL61_17930 [Burkholderia ubonensis]KWD26018.1 hypothetical protein WL62_10770 [Burkholderia ubonensis]
MAKTISKPMTAEQQAMLMHFTNIGLKWVAGQMSFEEVTRRLGRPEFRSEQIDIVEYVYFPEKVMSISFIFNRLRSTDGKPSIDTFSIQVRDDVRTNIPYERFDSLGLHRVVRGESIDGVRTEAADFFYPTGIAQVYGIRPKNSVTFSYRLPLNPDSKFDVYAGFGYLGEWVNESGEWTLNNFRNAVDLRSLNIGRHYLTPEELRQRQQAKRQKYGEMNLCTGMVCPETAIWQAWTSNGPTDAHVVFEGRPFPTARNLTYEEAKEQQRYPTREHARWMWLKEYNAPEVDF